MGSAEFLDGAIGLIGGGSALKNFVGNAPGAVADLVFFLEVSDVGGDFGLIDIIFVGVAFDVLNRRMDYFEVVLVVGLAGAAVGVLGLGLGDELNKGKGYDFGFFVIILEHSLLMF